MSNSCALIKSKLGDGRMMWTLDFKAFHVTLIESSQIVTPELSLKKVEIDKHLSLSGIIFYDPQLDLYMSTRSLYIIELYPSRYQGEPDVFDIKEYNFISGGICPRGKVSTANENLIEYFTLLARSHEIYLPTLTARKTPHADTPITGLYYRLRPDKKLEPAQAGKWYFLFKFTHNGQCVFIDPENGTVFYCMRADIFFDIENPGQSTNLNF